MDLNAVFDHLGNALDTIEGLHTFDYHADRILVPGAMVLWPETFNYDLTMRRGSDRFNLPIAVAVGRLDSKTSRKTLAQFFDSTNPKSLKNAIESYNGVGKPWDSVRVSNATFGIITNHGIEYLGAQVFCDVVGK